MKTITEIFRIIYALVVGFLASLGIGVFAVLILDKNRNVLGIVPTMVIGLFALFVGYQIYNTVRRRGVADFVNALKASPDMDNLDPSDDSMVRKVSVKEFVDFVNEGNNFFKGRNIRIWGDWNGRKLENIHQLKRAKYKDGERLLEIAFRDKSQVYIWNPQRIIETDTYLKILKADKVRWEWKSINQKSVFYYDYRVENGKIKTGTNSDWKGDEMDTLLGEPAIFMLR